ncbi:MAG TPA: hypothetical protein VH165_19365, partial [Kofleriaceae bacterium]|nr:hypothetical protein [Kofleriaceae bacterium]
MVALVLGLLVAWLLVVRLARVAVVPVGRLVAIMDRAGQRWSRWSSGFLSFGFLSPGFLSSGFLSP